MSARPPVVPELPVDPSVIVARACAPVRAALEEAFACACGMTPTVLRHALAAQRAARYSSAALRYAFRPPDAAWEALAARGVVPADWVDDPRRRFVTARYFRRGELVLETAARPPATEACVAVASDVAGVTTAEALARECATRLARWRLDADDAAAPDAVAWRVVPRDEWRWSRRAEYDVTWGPSRAAMEALGEAGLVCDFGKLVSWSALERRLPIPLAMRVQHDTTAAAWWNAAARAGLAVPRGGPDARAWPEALEGARFDALPDPLAPLVELWASGYALEAITPEAIVLLAPSV